MMVGKNISVSIDGKNFEIITKSNKSTFQGRKIDTLCKLIHVSDFLKH